MSSRARPTRSFEAFESELRRSWRVAADLVVLRATASTNADARWALASEPVASRPRVFVAWGQSAGRGRRGRGWSSPAGAGVYASVLTPPRRPSELALLPLLLPVVVCGALEALGVAGCGLKWPNDLLVRGRKLGGLLIEAVAAGGDRQAAILGVGVNRAAPSAPELARSAVGLQEILRPAPSLAALVCRIVEPVVERCSVPDAALTDGLLAAYRGLTVHRLGERLACRTASETLEGDFAGFDERGFLRLAVAGGERTIASGEVVERADGRA